MINGMEVTLIDHMGSDLTVVNAARVSFNKESDWESIPEAGPVRDFLRESDEKLIKYLAKHNHWTPFAHTSLQFRIKAPIFVARQLGKHQVGLVWNEISRRYVDYEPEFYYPEYWRGRPDNKKQGSSEEEIDINPSSGSGPAMVDDYEQAIQRCSWTYNELLRKGVAPEMARMVLPQSMFTEWYWTGSLVSFARVCSLRIKVDAQEETRDIASLIEVECANCFPTSWEALTQLP
jgi:thymidylate synthase (FAD)